MNVAHRRAMLEMLERVRAKAFSSTVEQTMASQILGLKKVLSEGSHSHYNILLGTTSVLEVG